jgi:flagellar biosynthesis/type III secretory pathway M-ring protein FliF/YscJ
MDKFLEKLIGLRRMIIVLWSGGNVMVICFLPLWVRVEAYGLLYAGLSAIVSLAFLFFGQKVLEEKNKGISPNV